MVRQSRTPFGSPFLTETFVRPLVSTRRESQTHYCSFLTESFSSSCSFVSRKVRMYRLLLFLHLYSNRVLDQFYFKFCSRNWISLSNLLWVFWELHRRRGEAAQSAPPCTSKSIHSIVIKLIWGVTRSFFSENTWRLRHNDVTDSRRASRRHKAALWNNFWVFYVIKLKFLTMIELSIPKNRMIFGVFFISTVFDGKMTLTVLEANFHLHLIAQKVDDSERTYWD